MAQITDLNVTPYYDDFDETDNFYRVLFRPGFAVQARELTTLQSILQNQIEKFGNHIFKENTIVIPGQLTYTNEFTTIQLASSFSNTTIDPSQYFNETTPVKITGSTSGVTATVIGFTAATTTSQPILHVRYQDTGTDNETTTFANGENISANVDITHGTSTFSSGTASATTHSGAGVTAARTGSAVDIKDGIFYIRGQFVRVLAQTLVLDFASTTLTTRVGFTINEQLITPSDDETLLDNARGSNNFAAQGAHRLKISLTLAQLATDSTADSSFAELMRIKNGVIQSEARNTEYSVLGDAIARRTFEESGDYTVRPFTFEVKESVNSDVKNESFDGVFTNGATTDDGNTASSSLLSLSCSTGKAFVGGFEIEKIAPTIKDINKARDFNTINSGTTSLKLGNFVRITNLHGLPDIANVAGEVTPYKKIELFDAATATRGSSSGNRIGVARARATELLSGSHGEQTAIYKLHLFDIQMFTKITLNASPSATLVANQPEGGVRVTGATSGATGFVFKDGTSGTSLFLTDVTGTFEVGENLTASDRAGNFGVADNVETFKFTQTRQVFMDDVDSGQDFTADISITTITTSQSAINLEDNAYGGLSDHLLLETNSSVQLEAQTSEGTAGISNIAKLEEPEDNILVYKLPKDTIKTLLTTANNGATDSIITKRRQFVTTSSGSGSFSVSADSNETFVAVNSSDFIISVLTAGTGTAAQGDILSFNSTNLIRSQGTLTFNDDDGALGDGAKVKVIATVQEVNVSPRIKTPILSKQLQVNNTTNAATDAFGIRPTDEVITLGRADVFSLGAVFDGEGTEVTFPVVTTLSTNTNTFVVGEKITGGTSNFEARIIQVRSNDIDYYPLNAFAGSNFTVGETITGASSNATATVNTVTEGSKNITSRYTLDTGQRDNFYDHARIVRKRGSQAPIGDLIVIHDYFEHSGGGFFSVDSYSELAGRVQYDDIPTYTRTKIDRTKNDSSSIFELRDCLDFRPTVQNLEGTDEDSNQPDAFSSVTIASGDFNSFDFDHRIFSGTALRTSATVQGANVIDIPKPNSTSFHDFEFFLSKIVNVYLTRVGDFKIVEGTSAEIPEPPKDLDESMLLATLFIPAFTFKPSDVSIERTKNQRFTMSDIGKLKERIENLERVTSLSLLEKSASSFQITDVNGLDRFKSGFLVDNFSGHSVGDVSHPDYKIAIDMLNREMRPESVLRNTSLIESVSTDSQRTSAGYQKTGDLITLPYTTSEFVDQPYATTTENVQAFLILDYTGFVELTPSGDEWFETEKVPAIVTNQEGNFDQIAAGATIGTVWNAWENNWSGRAIGIGFLDAAQRRGRNINLGMSGGGVIRSPFGFPQAPINRNQRVRTGITTRVIEDFDEEVIDNRVVSKGIVPFVRSRTVSFTGRFLKPNTKVFPFFNGVNVSSFVRPTGGSLGGTLTTDSNGTVTGTFEIPDHKLNELGVQKVPVFRTGELEFKLTSNSTNSKSVAPVTEATSTYHANGVLERVQDTIVSTRNAIVVREETRQTRRIQRRKDTLAQTFLVQETGGCFLTKVDVFFASKDTNNLPVRVEIRNVVDGYPGPKVVPFGRKSLAPSSVNVDATTGSSATSFTFDSPVFLEEGIEYCVVILTNSLEYRVWTSEMGKPDVSGSNRFVSRQPHMGSLFKSQNNTAWSAVQSQDLKFKLHKATFSTTTGTVTLNNDIIGDEVTDESGTTVYGRRLDANPIVIADGSNIVQIRHKDHGMYSTANNVRITGVSSGITTTLSSAVAADGTSVVLASATNFVASNDGSDVYIKINNEILKGTISSKTITTSSAKRGLSGTTAAAHSAGDTVELYQIQKLPLTEINKVHTTMSNIEIDSYTITTSSFSPTITGNSTIAEVGGSSVFASENYRIETGKTTIGVLQLPETQITSTISTITGTSPSGTQTSFATTSSETIPVNENFNFSTTRMVASDINETNELSTQKSLSLALELKTTNSNVSPVIDTDRLSLISIGNRVNNIDGSSAVYRDYRASTESEGDNNSAIYLTKEITLENPATSIRVILAGVSDNNSEIKLMFKALPDGSDKLFSEIGYTFFNVDGSPDADVENSLSPEDFRDYVYTAGVLDDGLGTPLDEFTRFQIKIVLQGTDSANPPKVKDLRVFALAT